MSSPALNMTAAPAEEASDFARELKKMLLEERQAAELHRQQRARHPHESAETFTIVQGRTYVAVKRLRKTLCLPVADAVPNAWILRANENLIIPPRSSLFYNTGLQFFIPEGLMGVVSQHPYEHGNQPRVETLFLHEHLPAGGVKLRLTNTTDETVYVSAGHFIGMVHFQKSSRVELEEVEETPPLPRKMPPYVALGTNPGPDKPNGWQPLCGPAPEGWSPLRTPTQ